MISTKEYVDKNDRLDVGYIYAPYIPIVTTPIIDIDIYWEVSSKRGFDFG